MQDSRVVANQFLELAKADGNSLMVMQLLKLVYLAHGWMLGLYGRSLIKDEVQAWTYGPVIPKLYEEIREFKGGSVIGPIASPPSGKLDKEEEDIVQQTYQKYKKFDGLQLSQITHQAGTPWTQTYDGSFGVVIPNEVIQAYYEEKIRQAES